jgi:uncharacterized protein YbjT (DUF2867 family)
MSDRSGEMKIVLFGGTGTAGSCALEECLADPRVKEVISVTRRPTGRDDPKLVEVIHGDFLDFDAIAEHFDGVDACFYCLGVSQSDVSEEARYREITYDYTFAAARLLKERSPGHVFHFLSGSGTDPSGRSRWMWARIKGEAERDLQDLGLAGVICYRPGYIRWKRLPEGAGAGKKFAQLLFPVFAHMPGMSLSAEQFGRAMIQAQLDGKRDGVLENRDLIALAERYGSR